MDGDVALKRAKEYTRIKVATIAAGNGAPGASSAYKFTYRT